MEQKTPWWHRFLTKECIVVGLVSFGFGVWTAWFHFVHEPPHDPREPGFEQHLVNGHEIRSLTCEGKITIN